MQSPSQPAHDDSMTTSGASIQALADQLRELAQRTANTKAELADWYRRARAIEDALLQPGGLASSMPHFVWHFLADADIRSRDADYAALQNQRIQRFLQYLSVGVIPSDGDLDTPH